MDLKKFKNAKGDVTGLCVVVDCVAGRDDEVLEGLVANFTMDRPTSVLPVSVGYIKTKGDYIIPMIIKDIAEVDDVLIDRVRSVPGISDIKSYIFNLHVPDIEEDREDDAPEVPMMAHGIVFIDVECGKDRQVLKTIAASSDNDVSINFLGHCFHSFDCDMIAFVSAFSHSILFEWVKERIRTIDGVLDTDIDIISGMEPLILPDEVYSLLDELARLDED